MFLEKAMKGTDPCIYHFEAVVEDEDTQKWLFIYYPKHPDNKGRPKEVEVFDLPLFLGQDLIPIPKALKMLSLKKNICKKDCKELISVLIQTL